MTTLVRPLVRNWLILAFLASAVMLLTAHAFEKFGGYKPCMLCLFQRNVYWWALGVSGAGLAASLRPPAERLKPLVFVALALIFLVGAGIAAYHAGAEWKWWPGPQACSAAGGSASVEQLKALMHGAVVHAPHCNEDPLRGKLGLSMAGWNVLASLAFAGFSVAAARESLRRD